MYKTIEAEWTVDNTICCSTSESSTHEPCPTPGVSMTSMFSKCLVPDFEHSFRVNITILSLTKNGAYIRCKKYGSDKRYTVEPSKAVQWKVLRDLSCIMTKKQWSHGYSTVFRWFERVRQDLIGMCFNDSKEYVKICRDFVGLRSNPGQTEGSGRDRIL